jgi:hypothetical protein
MTNRMLVATIGRYVEMCGLRSFLVKFHGASAVCCLGLSIPESKDNRHTCKRVREPE